uniref:Uncharacterized protein n=1 Tax=Anguilla anguilla TaxID=7936 RepID=A0A0E9QM43_ANGAN
MLVIANACFLGINGHWLTCLGKLRQTSK